MAKFNEKLKEFLYSIEEIGQEEVNTFKERLLIVIICFPPAAIISTSILLYFMTGFFILDFIYWIITGKSLYNWWVK